MKSIVQLLHFGYHQAMSCIFPVAIFGTLYLTSVYKIPFIHRYDAILLILLIVQLLMYLYRMPLTLAFVIVGFFIWLAENIATFFNAWKYPDQHQGWQIVSFSKISSWFLLVIISVIIVAQLKYVKANRKSSLSISS